MAKAFPFTRKGFPRALEFLRAAIAGGQVNDSVEHQSSGSASLLDVEAFESRVTSSGTQGNESVQIPSGSHVGQRHLVTFVTEGDASDVVVVSGAVGTTVQSQGAVGETPSSITNIALDTPGEFVLLEYQGANTWNVLYTTGAIT